MNTPKNPEAKTPCWLALRSTLDFVSALPLAARLNRGPGDYPESLEQEFSREFAVLATDVLYTLQLPLAYFGKNYPLAYEVVCAAAASAPPGTTLADLKKVIRCKLSARINEKLAAFAYHKK